MSLADIKASLERTGYPVTYRAWPVPAAPPLPFICYMVTGTDNFYADNEVYCKIERVQIELYTKLKDLAAEARVEAAMLNWPWQKTESYLDAEQCYQILYEIEVQLCQMLKIKCNLI